jgi:hypothetical protein
MPTIAICWPRPLRVSCDQIAANGGEAVVGLAQFDRLVVGGLGAAAA